MRLSKRSAFAAAVTACLLAPTSQAYVSDPGFEGYTVAPGGFTQVQDSPWTFNIYTTGVTEPFTTTIPATSAPGTPYYATFSAYEGSQYVSAYAGNGSFTQNVSLTPGEYELSVWAASPEGQIDLASHTIFEAISDLETGLFSFVFDTGTVGPVFEPPLVLEAGWVRFSTTVEVTETGSYTVGVHHQKIAPYFINYDMFQVTATPEPSSLGLLGFGGLMMMNRRRRSA